MSLQAVCGVVFISEHDVYYHGDKQAGLFLALLKSFFQDGTSCQVQACMHQQLRAKTTTNDEA